MDPRIRCAVLVAVAACDRGSSVTDLHPGGPPMIEQIRIIEIDPSGSERSVFGFGTYPTATADQAHPVTTAKAANNRLRIILDELLRGNQLEEIECRYAVDDDAFAAVPVGATPDDIARCAVAQDMLLAHCPGSNPLSVCLCANAAGCPSGTLPDGSPSLTPRGESVGVLDSNQDGAADSTRFIEGAVGITCGAVDVPIDLEMSYWTPSGDQQGAFDALGPAIVVVPGAALPTSMTCGLTIAPTVVDDDGNRVCAPPNGNIASGCTPGDTTAPAFTVQPLGFALETAIVDPGQSRLDDIAIMAAAPLDPASIANIAVTQGAATPYLAFTVTLPEPDAVVIHWTAVGGLAASTRYTITVPTAVTDAYHQAAPQPFQVSFTTGTM